MLHQIGGVHRLLLVGLVLLGPGTGCRIDLLQLGNGKGCLGRVLTCVIFIKIYQIRLALLQLCNNQSHLQTPVTQMDIAGHVVAHEASQTLHALTDDGRAEMSHMQRLRHVGSTVVNDNGLRILCSVTAQALIICHSLQILLHIRRRSFRFRKPGLTALTSENSSCSFKLSATLLAI